MVAVKTSEIKENLNKLDTLDKEDSLHGVTTLIEKFDDILGKLYKEQVNCSEDYILQIKSLVKAIYSKIFGKEGRISFLFAHRGTGLMFNV